MSLDKAILMLCQSDCMLQRQRDRLRFRMLKGATNVGIKALLAEHKSQLLRLLPCSGGWIEFTLSERISVEKLQEDEVPRFTLSELQWMVSHPISDLLLEKVCMIKSIMPGTVLQDAVSYHLCDNSSKSMAQEGKGNV